MINEKVARQFIEEYRKGKFDDTEDKFKVELEREYQKIVQELENPLEKAIDDPNAVLVPMGFVGYTTSLSHSPRLKTFGLASCLGLVSKCKPVSKLTNQSYNSGSLSHVAATLDTNGLVSRIVAKHRNEGIYRDQINFEIHATSEVSKKLLDEVKEGIYKETGQKNIKEDIRMVHSSNIVYDFETGKVYEIPKLDLSLPEYKGLDLMVPPPNMPYRMLKDGRTEISLEKVMDSLKNRLYTNNSL